MFQFIKGASIRDISDLKEGYRVNDNVLIANVSAEKIPALFEAFLNSMRDDELLFMFIEAPCTMDDELKYNNIGPDDDQIIENCHVDIYYLDGFLREHMIKLLKSEVGILLINDGRVCFGFGSEETHIELGKYKYNTFTGYSINHDISCISDSFDETGIPQVPDLVSAPDLLSHDNPGMSSAFAIDGKDICTLLEDLKELGIYKAETREEYTGEVVWKLEDPI